MTLYFLPIVTIDLPPDPAGQPQDYKVPKYLRHRLNPALAGLESCWWAWTMYQREGVALIAVDADATQEAILDAQLDVLKVPPLDTAIPNAAARNQVRTYLEALNVPATNWVQTGMTYRTVLRVVLGFWQFYGRVVSQLARGRRLFADVTLDQTIADLPVDARDALSQAAADLNVDTTGVNGTTTIREALRLIGEQSAGRVFQLGPVTI